MGQSQNTSQLIIGRAQAVSNDGECGGRFSDVVEDVARRVLDAIGDSKPNNTEQICSSVDHRSEDKCGAHIFQLDCMCAAHIIAAKIEEEWLKCMIV